MSASLENPTFEISVSFGVLFAALRQQPHYGLPTLDAALHLTLHHGRLGRRPPAAEEIIRKRVDHLGRRRINR
jgi:hypothetical protein